MCVSGAVNTPKGDGAFFGYVIGLKNKCVYIIYIYMCIYIYINIYI